MNKKYILPLIVSASAAMFAAGCGTKTVVVQSNPDAKVYSSAQELAGVVKGNMNAVNYFTIEENFRIDAKISAYGQSSDMKMEGKGSGEMQLQPEYGHFNLDMNQSSSAGNVSSKSESYISGTGANAKGYIRTNGGEWSKDTSVTGIEFDALMEQFAGKSLIESVSNGETIADIDNNGGQVNGKDTYKISAHVNGDIAGASFSDSLSSLNAVTGDWSNLYADMDLYIYKDSALPAKITVDGAELLKGIMEGMGIDCQVREYTGEFTINDYNNDSASVVTIPDNVILEAGDTLPAATVAGEQNSTAGITVNPQESLTQESMQINGEEKWMLVKETHVDHTDSNRSYVETGVFNDKGYLTGTKDHRGNYEQIYEMQFDNANRLKKVSSNFNCYLREYNFYYDENVSFSHSGDRKGYVVEQIDIESEGDQIIQRISFNDEDELKNFSQYFNSSFNLPVMFFNTDTYTDVRPIYVEKDFYDKTGALTDYWFCEIRYDANNNEVHRKGINYSKADDSATTFETTYEYDTNGNMIFEENKVDEKGVLTDVITEKTYDSDGNVLSSSEYNNTDGKKLIKSSEYKYDSDGNVLSSSEYNYTDGKKLIESSEYKYDSKGNITEKKNYDAESGKATNTIYEYLYDDKGYPLSYKKYEDDNREVVSETCDYEYDSSGRLLSTVQHIGDSNTWEKRYNNYGILIYDKHSFETGDQTIHQYDDYGNLIYVSEISSDELSENSGFTETYYEYKNNKGVVSGQHNIDI